MPQRMTGCRLHYSRFARPISDCPLQHLLINVVSSCLAAAGINGSFSCGEDVLPGPLPARALIFPFESIRQIYLAKTICQILFMHRLNLEQMSLQPFGASVRQHGDSVLCPLPVPHRDLTICEIEVFNPQSYTFHESQSRPVEQRGHQPILSI